MCLEIMLIDRVRAVALARDLGKWDDILGALLLAPQAVHVDVPHLGDPLAVEDDLGGSRIELEGDAKVRAQVIAESLEAKTPACPSDSS